jgi:hypothetical protein
MSLKLSLLISFRNRKDHAETLLEWFRQLDDDTIEAVFIEQDAVPTIQQLVESAPNCRYIFQENAGTFHLSKALNTALASTNAPLVAPYDIDLIPFGDTLTRQLRFALQHPQLVFSGYRLMSLLRRIDQASVVSAVAASEISISEHPHYVKQRLVENQRYGVIPFLRAERLREIGGWDERYVGWGAEDQDMLDRYITDEMLLVRSEEFVYLHQHHGFEPNWREEEFTQKNREIFYSTRKVNT